MGGGYTKDGVGHNVWDTSKEAAETVKPSLRDQILRVLLDAGPPGLADFQLEDRSNYRHAGQRRNELVKRNLVRVKPDEKRKNPQGKLQRVWTAFDDDGKQLKGLTT